MKIIYTSLLFAATLMACNSENSTSQTNTADLTSENQKIKDSIPPVETNKANADYEPAFEGQTRISGVKTTTPFQAKVITEDLDSPWGAVELPDGRLLVTEKEGVLKIVNIETGELSEEITGLPEVDDRAQGGLLGITISPDFENDRMVYWTFTEEMEEGNHTAVAKGKLADDEKTIENAQVIFRTSPTYDGKLHYGGRILFNQEGNLFVSVGERSDKETRDYAQDLGSTLGKIVHITTDGKAVEGNPFADQEGALPEIYSYGHRNPQGLAFHPVTGELWSNEFGPRGGDELNLIKPGNNYGWPVITYGIEYIGTKIGDPVIQQKEGMEQPVYYWDPVISASGMTFYAGNNIPEWENNLFLAGLSSNFITRLVIEDNKVVGEERLLTEEGERFRDIIQGENGVLYTITDGGKLYLITN
ncbi:PQQ-dependent sugar dehydrogenase [Brumimicrobium aurantiacum]|uniref:PQQ-dependent sugar dehydrogenase n=1 Tax=Brumimicrobium aurantiacum TaxID=1737063 RepID=A0A3E1EYH7_9FLAO|nr:PQQ-dependent sugar dehydrogenase [Brumimicrobium aurantiacum]RFC54615.1 PQQ-dependent sugar dehydrogenase [Brumimicrobium aurantiacum]